MKKWFILSLIGALLVNCSNGQQSPRVSAEGKDVKVSYGQPTKRDRVIFGKLVPYGKVWRTGANEATEVTFAKDTKVGGKAIKAGTYSLFTIPTEKEWTIVLNSELKQWGSENYDNIKSKNVLEVTAPVKALDKAVEKLTIRFDGGNMIIEWDTTQVQVKLG